MFKKTKFQQVVVDYESERASCQSKMESFSCALQNAMGLSDTEVKASNCGNITWEIPGYHLCKFASLEQMEIDA
jgi:hypothetical protein